MASEAKGRYLWEENACRWFVRGDTVQELREHYNTFGRDFDTDHPNGNNYAVHDWAGVHGVEGLAKGMCWQEPYLADLPAFAKANKTFIMLGIATVCIALFLLYKYKK